MYMIEDEEVQRRIHELVKAGFMTAQEIVDDICHHFEIDSDGDIFDLRKYALPFAQGAIEEHIFHQRTWGETDCDKLDEAFAELDRIGIVARQNFACCQSCGHTQIGTEIDDTLEHRPVHGYVFFHQQDAEYVIAFNKLYLAYGAIDGDIEVSKSIAREVTKILRKHGLEVDWNGMIHKRICILNIKWQRRRLPERISEND